MNEEEKLKKICQLLRYYILTSTTAAGSGHPTSSLSAVELMAALFFGGNFNFEQDKIIFSKGHAAPLLYSLYTALGLISEEELMTLRQFNSNLEGHPTPRCPLVEVATGSLGQGLSVGVGFGLGQKFKSQNSKFKSAIQDSKVSNVILSGPNSLTASSAKNLINRDSSVVSLPQNDRETIYVLLGDSEMSEGQNYEAMQLASYYHLNNLVAILDVNRLGQRGETMVGWDLAKYAKRSQAFGWLPIIIEDGHNLLAVQQSFQKARSADLPVMLIAKTVKGKGVSFLENKEGWHGKTLDQEQLKLALNEVGAIHESTIIKKIRSPKFEIRNNDKNSNIKTIAQTINPNYQKGQMVATREAYGDALVELGKQATDLIVLDAETGNSTFAEKFKKAFPKRFLEMFIAEQNMISTALGLSKTGFVPFVSSFAAFLNRGFDQIRMSQYSEGNIKICGSHCGVSIGADGPSQMGLEDMAMMRSIINSVVLYPSDAVSAFKLTAALYNQPGLGYLRTTREKLPVLYDNNEDFPIGKAKILRQSDKDKAVIFAAGITLHEAIAAYEKLKAENILVTVVDLYSVKPIDEELIKELAKKTQKIITVEDHYLAGGLGEAVNTVLKNERVAIINLAVKKIPRSGKTQELLKYEEIDREAIERKVKIILGE